MIYDYEIKFSKRRTLSITVSADNKIILRCPLGYSRERAEKFLYEKSAWIERAVSKNENKKRLYEDIISYQKIFVQGEKLPLFTGCKKNGVTKEGVFVKDLKNIRKLFIDNFGVPFAWRVEEISRLTGLKHRSVQIKNYKSRWGCCDALNNIAFNYKLIMLPEDIQYYVIVHELCHTVYHNHSDKFWRLVEKFVPNLKRVKKDLRGYDFITTLY